MNLTIFNPARFAAFLLLAGCGSAGHLPPATQPAAVPHPARIQTITDAVAVVRRAVAQRGGDPDGAEYHAHRSGGRWFVAAWAIRYPRNTGSSRFVPGGFTTYIVSDDGRISETIPGR